MQYFDLSEDDSWKIHMLFSPQVVPKGLTKEQIQFCITLQDKIRPKNSTVLEERLVELWFAIKQIEDEKFAKHLLRIFYHKMSVTQQVRREMRYAEAFHAFIASFPEQKRKEYILRFFTAHPPEDWVRWWRENGSWS